MAHTIEINDEILDGDTIYNVWLETELDFRNEEDPECCHVEITQAEVSLDEKPLKLNYEGKQIEKLIVVGHPNITETIDGLLWSAIQTYTEDNYRDLIRELEDAKDDYYL
jgi:hypothetical protein